jgi:uroporphyrinogen-III synthase
VVERLAREELAGSAILIPRAAEARDVLPRELARRGARVDVVPVYRTVQAPPDPEVLAALLGGRIDVVTFTSSSTVTNLLKLVAEYQAGNSKAPAAPAGISAPLGGALIACIGPVTAQTAREHGLRVGLVAEEHSIPGLVKALADWAMTSSEPTTAGKP